MTVLRPLPPCGRGPCVSTQAPRTDPVRRIEPLAIAAPGEVAIGAVLAALGRVPRLRILERDAVSVHAVVRSAWLRVPTDLELRVDASAGLVHLRASTLLALRERSSIQVQAHEVLALIDRELRAG